MLGYIPIAGMLGLCGLAGWAVLGGQGAAAAVFALLGVVILQERQQNAGAAVQIRGIEPQKQLSPGFSDRLATLAREAGFENSPSIAWVAGPPNAYVIGNRQRAKVIVTESLHDLLDENQLLAVIAHEFAHARTGDSQLMKRADLFGRLSFNAALLALLIGAGAYLFQGRVLAPGWVWWVLAVGPTLMSALYYATMRHREYAADAEAAQLVGNPQTLSQALARIQFAMKGPDLRSTIEEFAGIKGRGWWRTHPPLEQRIARLEQRAS